MKNDDALPQALCIGGNRKLAIDTGETYGLEYRDLRRRATTWCETINDIFVGKQFKRWGHTYQCAQISVGLALGIMVTGVRVSKSGKAGTRQFDCGSIGQCQWLDDVAVKSQGKTFEEVAAMVPFEGGKV